MFSEWSLIIDLLHPRDCISFLFETLVIFVIFYIFQKKEKLKEEVKEDKTESDKTDDKVTHYYYLNTNVDKKFIIFALVYIFAVSVYRSLYFVYLYLLSYYFILNGICIGCLEHLEFVYNALKKKIYQCIKNLYLSLWTFYLGDGFRDY